MTRRWLRYRSMVNTLSAMSDSQLRDIGIHRGDIFSVVRLRHAQ